MAKRLPIHLLVTTQTSISLRYYDRLYPKVVKEMLHGVGAKELSKKRGDTQIYTKEAHEGTAA
jgi:hypothetical protein